MKAVHVVPVTVKLFGEDEPITVMYKLTVDLDALAKDMVARAHYASRRRASNKRGAIVCEAMTKGTKARTEIVP
jgi:hypothetical protein